MEALIFDFDGLILDTESAAIESWRLLYNEQQLDFPMELFQTLIGTAHGEFDPLQYLVENAAGDPDPAKLHMRSRHHILKLLSTRNVLPGIKSLLTEVRNANIRTAIASSSTRSWVESHLFRLKLFEYFDAMATRDDVQSTKPDPALYLLAAKKLRTNPKNCIALEDSNHGVVAAMKAGMRVVAIPHQYTENMDFSAASLVVRSAEELDLQRLIHLS